MKLFYAKLVFLCVLLTFSLHQNTLAQTTRDSTSSKKSHFRASLGYLTNSVYNGRKDTVANPYLNTEIGYYHKSGFNISASASYQPNNKVFDVFSIDAGYNLEISDQLSATFLADKPFYNKSSTTVSSGIKGSIDAGLTYDPGFISVDASIGTVFSKKTDILISGSLSHLFLLDGFDDESFWGIAPSFSTNFGTQNFYQDYKTRSSKKKLLSASSSTVGGNSHIQLLDYEFSLPISYDTKRWGLTVLPIYAIPRNPVTTTTTTTITTVNKTRTFVSTDTEKLQNVFYAQFTVDFKF